MTPTLYFHTPVACHSLRDPDKPPRSGGQLFLQLFSLPMEPQNRGSEFPLWLSGNEAN